jgi:hypothetical protein
MATSCPLYLWIFHQWEICSWIVNISLNWYFKRLLYTYLFIHLLLHRTVHF